MIRRFLLSKFYQSSFSLLLLPLWLLERLSKRIIESRFQQRQINPTQTPPVIIVGNISLGGVGKTPIVAHLAYHFVKQHIKVVIISRGYGAGVNQFPFVVTPESDALLAGDEPVMLAQATQCDVVISPKRLGAYEYAKDILHADIVISDDGLQHYALPRAYEICVMDAQRFLGNRHCIPAGPLREPPQRLATVDAVLLDKSSDYLKELQALVEKRHIFQYKRYNTDLINTDTQERLSASEFIAHYGEHIHAVCAIGHAQSYFSSLRMLGFEAKTHQFIDHHQFIASDFDFVDALPIVMTHKDAVKCKSLNLYNTWVLDLAVELPESLLVDIHQKLKLN